MECSFMNFTFDGIHGLFLLITLVSWLMTGSCLPWLFRVTKNNRRFLIFYVLTGLAATGIFLSADLFTTFFFFELMTLVSFAYVGNDETDFSRKAALSYLAYGIIGGLMMLFGVLLLYSQFGTLDYELLQNLTDTAGDKTTLYIAGACLLFGFGAKAGMFPLHTWLPDTYTAAPCAGTTVLSTVLSKAGIFGIYMTTTSLFYHDTAWELVILIFGCLTMFTGGFLGLFSINLKRTLACSSMSQIGFILVAIGTRNSPGVLFHSLNHSLFKLILFTVVTMIFAMTKELDYNRLAGFANHNPKLKIPFLCAALGISGVPFFSGFLSKTLIHGFLEEYMVFAPYTNAYKITEWIFLLSGGMTFAYMLKMYFAIFRNHRDDNAPENEQITEDTCFSKPSVFSVILLFLLALVCPAVGLYPGTLPAVLTPENLKGILISLSMGGLIYLLLIRPCMTRKRKAGNFYVTHYSDIYPSWLDIERLIYVPLLTKFLPFIGAFFSRLADRLVDGFSILMMRTLLRPRGRSHIKNDHPLAYIIGKMADSIYDLIHVKIRKQPPVPHASYADLFTVGSTEFSRTTKLIFYSVSFGLFMFAMGLMATLLYLLYTIKSS